MKRAYVKFMLAMVLIVALCNNCSDDDDEVGTGSASVTALDCDSATISASATVDVVYSGTATVPYTGGNGVSYSEGAAISSTGVSGLTAVLEAGTLESGAGELTYTITGTAESTGTASFAITFGGQSCSIEVTVAETVATTDCDDVTGVEKVVCLANAFLATLSTSQQADVVLTLNLTNAKRWSNLPCGLSCRNGILFSDLTTAQETAALALISEAAGADITGEGYNEFQQIRAADDYLGTMNSGYSSGNYVIAFLGTPSTTGKWMLQYGGHHYASNITYDGGEVVSITPLHEAVEPNASFTVDGSTYSGPIIQELAAMQAMLGSFTSSELSSAYISSTFSDCLMVPGSTTNTFPTTKQGIQVGTLSSTAQTKVWTAISTWLNDVNPDQTATIAAAYEDELADTYVCYASNTSATVGNSASFLTAHTDYVRIDGPTIWIEFVCQNGVIISNQIHYHTVMRDHDRDYIGL